jgi:hypothetical protein
MAKKTRTIAKKNKQRVSKFIYWMPRILAILFIMFLTLFSLDVVSSSLSFWQIVIGLLMHNIPTLLLIIILIISWKYELVGAVAFTLAGIFYMVMVFTQPFKLYMLSWFIVIAGPAILVGVLFFINWYIKKKRK